MYNRHIQTIRIPLLLWVGSLCLYLLTSPAILDNPDARSAYSVTRSLVLHGTITIPPEARLDTMFEQVGRNGDVYSKYGLVQPLVQVPLFLLGRWWAPDHEHQATQRTVALLNAFTTATGLLLLYSLAHALFGSQRIALAIALTYGMATMAWLYATLTYSEPLLTLILLLTCRFLVAAEQHPAVAPLLLGAAGFCSGLAILTKYPAVIYLPALLWYAWMISRPARWNLLAFLLPLVSGVIALAGYNIWRYEDMFTTGYHIKELTRLPRPPWYGLYTLFFSLGKSLFIYAPPLLPALYLLPRFVRQAGAFGKFLVLLLISSILFYTVIRPWSGAWSPGPRYQLPVVPLALLTLGWVGLHWSQLTYWKQLVMIGMVTSGCLIQIPLVTTSYNDTLVMLQVITEAQYAWGFWFFDPDYMPLLWQSRILASALARMVGMPSLLPSPLPFSVDHPGQPIDQLVSWFARVPLGSSWSFLALLLATVAGACLTHLIFTQLMPRVPTGTTPSRKDGHAAPNGREG